jgi:hypothetical protein
MLRGFSHTERQAFLRFAWGQSRLPYNPKDFTQKMRIMTCQYNDDQHLPVTHTCFFQVELPKYSSREVRKNDTCCLLPPPPRYRSRVTIGIDM